MEVLILCIALAAGAIFSPIRSALLGAYWLVYSQLYLEYMGNYIILNNEILKSNSLVFPLNEGYISQYTSWGVYRQIVNENNKVNIRLMIV